MTSILKRHADAAILTLAGGVIALDLLNLTPWITDEIILFGCVYLMKKVRDL